MTDERKAFEAWYESPTRPFCESDTSAWGAAWAAWQARAALSAPPREPTEAMTAMAMELRKHAKWISEDGRPLNSATPLIRAASLLESLAAPAIPTPSAPAREAVARDIVGLPVGAKWDEHEGCWYVPATPATGVVEALRELVDARDEWNLSRKPYDDIAMGIAQKRLDAAWDAARAALAGQDKSTDGAVVQEGNRPSERGLRPAAPSTPSAVPVAPPREPTEADDPRYRLGFERGFLAAKEIFAAPSAPAREAVAQDPLTQIQVARIIQERDAPATGVVEALRELLIAEKLDDDDPRLECAREAARAALAGQDKGSGA
jgi:hypothetical protein